MIGNLGGKIVFEVSDKKVMNFTNFSQNVSAKWATHTRILGKAKSEFLGAELRTITFDMLLDAHLGVRPRTTLELLERMVEKGVSGVLVIGDKPIGEHQWKVKEIGETWDIVMNRGELARAKVKVTLEETL